MSYWDKSLYCEMLTERTNNLLTDLTNEGEKLSVAYTAFGDLENNSISYSPSIYVIRNIAGKYQSVIDGFITAVDYDMVDCNKLLGYISEEPEDLSFGELHGQWEVAKQNRDNEEAAKNKYIRENSGTKTVWEWILDVLTEVTIHITPDELVVANYNRRINNYQKEMDAWQAKLDRLGEFEDRSGKLFANSVDFRTNAIKALSDLKDCVSSDGTFKDIGYSSALNKLNKLHEQRQEDYLKQWLDKDGNIDMDAVEKFLFQDPDSVTMDQYLAFCKLMDQMSDEQMTEMMNRASRIVPNDDCNGAYLEFSVVIQRAADINAELWCARYKAAGYPLSYPDEEAMNRAIAIKYATVKLAEMAPQQYVTDEVYKYLPVYVDGSNVYFYPCIYMFEAQCYGADDYDKGVREIFKKIVANNPKGFSDHLNAWTVITVSNEQGTYQALINDASRVMNLLGGGDSATRVAWDNGRAFVRDQAINIGADIAGEVAEFAGPYLKTYTFALDLAEFFKDMQDERDKIHRNADGQQDLENLSYAIAFYLERGTTISYGGSGENEPMGVENVRVNAGDLQLALAAYNENNGGLDININWLYNYDKCTEAQKEALAKYVEWFHSAKGIEQREAYRNAVSAAYDEIKKNNDFTNPPAYDALTPAQLKEIQKYMKDNSYPVKIKYWQSTF